MLGRLGFGGFRFRSSSLVVFFPGTCSLGLGFGARIWDVVQGLLFATFRRERGGERERERERETYIYIYIHIYIYMYVCVCVYIYIYI